MKELAKYEVGGQEIRITDVDVRKVICDNPNVTDKEVKLFVELCKSQRLNPFVKEAYLVKYGSNPATMLVGKDVFLKRAQANPRFRGMQAGIFVKDAHGKGKEREGSMILPGETVLGGWAKVYVDGYMEPVYDSVSFDEYAGRKRDGSLNGQWKSKPGTMIRKVALVHALREAFPDDLSQLYDASEMAQAVEPVQAEPQPETVEVEAVAEGDTPYQRLCDAVFDYCEFSGNDYKRELGQLGITESTSEDWMLKTADNYRAATGKAA